MDEYEIYKLVAKKMNIKSYIEYDYEVRFAYEINFLWIEWWSFYYGIGTYNITVTNNFYGFGITFELTIIITE